MKVLVTGGAGYLGSHVCVALSLAGYEPVVLDNFSSCSESVIDRLAMLTGEAPIVERGDVLQTRWVSEVLHRHQPCCVIHLAQYSCHLRSAAERLHYLGNNLTMLASVLRAMESQGIHTLQVASSADVYAVSQQRLTEYSARRPESSLGHTHDMIENLLEGIRDLNASWRMAVLRHFNPSGAHPSGLIGASPFEPQPGLLHSVARACLGEEPHIEIYGDHVSTDDGSAVREFTHVCDAASAHVAALNALLDFDEGFCLNIGGGTEASALDLISTFEKVNRRLVPWQFSKKITTEAPCQLADTQLARQLLDWRPTHSLDEICADTLRWHSTFTAGSAQTSR